MATNFATKTSEALLAHDIDLMKVDAGTRKEIMSVMNSLEKQTVKNISKLGSTQGLATAKGQNAALKQVISVTAPDIDRAYKQMADVTGTSLTKLAAVESQFVVNELDRAFTVDLGLKKLSPEVLRLLPGEGLIEGAPFTDWFKKQSDDFRTAFSNQMREGIVNGESIDDMVRRVRGTRAGGFKDGLMETSRRNAQTLVRSSVLATANKAREAVYKKNSDVIKGVQWLATLDSRTSDICISLDGSAWFLSGKPMAGTSHSYLGPPPAHFNCRSTLIPITKSFSELAKDKKIKAKLRSLPKGKQTALRASMDGAVSSKLNYEKWLQTKSPAFQLEVLGPTKFRLWQAGQLSLRNLIDQSHNPMTVDALVAKTGVPKVTIDSALQTAKTTQPVAKAKATVATKAADDAFKASLKATDDAAADAAKAAQKAADEALAAKQAQEAAEAALAKQKELEAAKTEFKNLLIAGKKVPKALDELLLAIPESEYDDLLNEVSAAKKAAKKIADAKAAYTKATLAGEKVADDVNLALLDIDADELNAFLDSVAELKAAQALAVKKAAEEAAQAEAFFKLDKIIAQKATFEKRAYLKLVKAEPDFEFLPVTVQLEKIDAQVVIDKAAKKVSDGISNYKKAVLAGKNPPPASVKVFNELDDATQSKVIADIEKKKAVQVAAAEPPPPPTVADVITDYKAGKIDDAMFIEQMHKAKGTYNDTIANAIKMSGPGAKKITVESLLDGAEDIIAETKAQVTAGDVAGLKKTVDFKPSTPKSMTVAQIQDEAQDFLDAFRFGEYDEKEAIKKAAAILGSSKQVPAFLKLEPQGIDKVLDLFTTKLKAVTKNVDDAKAAIEKQGLKVAESAKDVAAAKAAIEKANTATQKVDDVVEVATAPPKPTVAVTAETAAPNMDELTRIGEQAGSNPGGLFQDATTGQKWYVKTPASAEVAKNEVLAAKFYEKMGIDVPELHVVQMNGRPSIASKIVDGLSENSAALRAGQVAGVNEGFVADAFLANWDVVGLNYDNLLVKAGKAFRVDTGGALRYRAQGGLKGSAFGNVVDEIDTLRNASTNRQSASVFGRVTDEELKAGARKVVALTDDDIAALVTQYGPEDAAENAALIEQLIARRNDIKRRFKIRATRKKPAPLPDDTGKDVTNFEAKQIADSRGNGFTLTRDKDGIEDQSILAWTEQLARGKERSMLQMKLRGDTADNLVSEIHKTVTTAPAGISTEAVDDAIKRTLIGMKHRADNGKLFDETIRDRAKDTIKKHGELRTTIAKHVDDGTLPKSALDDFDANYEPWIRGIRAEVAAHDIGETMIIIDDLPEGIFQVGKIGTLKPVARALDDAPAIKWTRTDAAFDVKQMKDGNLKATARKSRRTFGEAYEAEFDGVTVRYFAEELQGNTFALANRLEVIAPGKTHEQALSALRKLGINVDRATEFDAEELYLRQIMSHSIPGRRGAKETFNEFNSRLAATADPEARVKLARKLVSEHIGTDITKTPSYNYQGQYQAFNHGNRNLLRPDLYGDEWNKFTNDYRLHHANTSSNSMADLVDTVLNSGGNFIATTDKLRRGIALDGMSPDSDLRTGGASYFFTRLKTARNAHAQKGFVWKSNQVKRLDSISYDHDAFGRTAGDYVFENRATGIEQWKAAARGGGNETIFKNGMSIFDDLDAIIVGNESERRQVIDAIRRHKIDEWPDGRKLEEIVKVIV